LPKGHSVTSDINKKLSWRSSANNKLT
jgi:hypothetical protein